MAFKLDVAAVKQALRLVAWLFLTRFIDSHVTNGHAAQHDTVCKREYDCSTGCIAIVGNGAISRGQAEMALHCGDVYRANKMTSAATCANRATHCFYRSAPTFYHGVKGNGLPLNSHVTCPHTIFVNDDRDSRMRVLERAKRRWTNPGTYEAVTVEEYQQDPLDGPVKRVYNHLQNKIQTPSTGVIMMDYALRHRNGRCIHIFGFSFQGKRLSKFHEFDYERTFFAELLREDGGIFFHATPYNVQRDPMGTEPAFGLATSMDIKKTQKDAL